MILDRELILGISNLYNIQRQREAVNTLILMGKCDNPIAKNLLWRKYKVLIGCEN